MTERHLNQQQKAVLERSIARLADVIRAVDMVGILNAEAMAAQMTERGVAMLDDVTHAFCITLLKSAAASLAEGSEAMAQTLTDVAQLIASEAGISLSLELSPAGGQNAD